MPLKLIRLALLIILLAAGCAPAQSLSVPVPPPDSWPTAGWPVSTPEAQGMDSTRLAQMLAGLSAGETGLRSLLIVRNGHLVTEAYFHPFTRDTRVHVQSVTKSVIGMLIGRAVLAGTLADADARLLDFFPGRAVANPSRQKESIRLQHLLSMSSGLDCQEFSASGPVMEQSADWIQFMLDLPMAAAPGREFGYCNGSAHLLSAIVQSATDLSAREYANRELFAPLGIPPADPGEWPSDPQGITLGGYGLYLRPLDMAKLALLYLHNGEWAGRQLISAEWVAASTTQHIQKEDGSGYGYLWTLYPEAGHYAALGLGGQQIHIYPALNLIVITTAALESYAEAPEIEALLNDSILPAIRSDGLLAENAAGVAQLQSEIAAAANPVRPVPALPAAALEVAGSVYTFAENPLGWQQLSFAFEPGANKAQLHLNDYPALAIGLDNLYRRSTGEQLGEVLLRGHWDGERAFVVDYPYPASRAILGELGQTEFHFTFTGDALDVTVDELVFGGEPLLLSGTR